MTTSSPTIVIPTYRVDAFTDQPFAGNPAVVCLLEASQTERLGRKQLQQIAAENNQPVTAFVTLCDRSANFRTSETFELSWYSPTTELPLCGHGTLAAAAVLLQDIGNQHTTLCFKAQKRPVSVTKLDSTTGSLLQIKFPAAKATRNLPADLQLNNTSLQNLVGTTPVQDVLYNDARGVGMIVLAAGTSQAQLEALKPDLELLQSQLGDKHLNGVAVTCQGDGKHHHFLSRYWAPWLGVGEDAVTGSLHTVLTPYWDATLKMGGKPMKARQCSPRGGELQVTYAADEMAVYIAGEAVIMAKGQLTLPSADE